MVHQCHHIAARQAQRSIGVFGNAQIFLKPFYPNARVIFGPPLQRRDRFLGTRTAINDARFPVAVSLSHNRFK